MTIPANARILIIEDDAFISLMLQDMMSDLGLVVAASASTIAEATDLIRGSESFDLASLDLNLHGVISEPVAVALRERGIPFIVTTGYDDRYLSPVFQGQPRVEKPFLLEQLADAIAALHLDAPHKGKKSPGDGSGRK